MYFIIFSAFFTVSIAGHSSNTLLDDADMQSALMPQELNPEFVPDKDEPWRSIFPIPRTRRDLDILQGSTTTSAITAPSTVVQVKYYSRLVACVTLIAAAVVEIIVYLIETYAD